MKAVVEPHPLLADRVRLSLIAAVAASTEPVEFMELLEKFGLTKGNLSTHLRKLEDAKLVCAEKKFIARRPCTTYTCTSEGRKALELQLDFMEAMIRDLRAKAG